MVAINTELIILGGRTAMARKLPAIARKDVFNLGKCVDTWDDLYKAYLITNALEADNSYTQEEIQCLESELLNEIQKPENLQAASIAVGTSIISGTSGGIIIGGHGG